MLDASHLVRLARETAGLTQADLARRLGQPQSVVARIEAPGANPKIATLNKVVTATGQSIEATLAPSAGIDESMLAEDLRATPDRRLRNFESFYVFARRWGGEALDRRGS